MGLRGRSPADGTRASLALTAGGWAVGAAVTLLTLTTPYLLFGYRSPELHLVLGSVDGCVALLVSFLYYGRFVRSRRVQDLLLAEGMFLLAAAGLGLTLALDLLPQLRPETLDAWLPLTLRLVATTLLVGAALVGPARLTTMRGAAPLIAPWLLIGVGLAGMWSVHHLLPPAITQSPASAVTPVITGHPVLLGGNALMAAALLVASVLCTRQASGSGDELLRWVGPAFALGAFARVNYVLFPSLHSDWLYTGDLLRTASYLLLLVGAMREIRQYWSAQARVAVLEDRRRVARELHDGVVQELGYIRGEVQRLDEPGTDLIVAACDRGLDEARAAVDALGRDEDERLVVVLERAARQVAERCGGGQVEVEGDAEVPVSHEQRHALVRITREAVSNALRHGRAGLVRIRVSIADGARSLVIEDDGHGFDLTEAARSHGYGLASMRDRARGLPGNLTVESTPTGTRVGVIW